MQTIKIPRRRELIRGRLDITPLVDVVFLLIIFFMLTSTFVIQPGIEVKLPKAITSEALEEKNLIISLTDDGKIYLDRNVVSLDKLKAELKEVSRQGRAVLIKADQKISLGNVVEVWDLCRDIGIAQVSIATEP